MTLRDTVAKWHAAMCLLEENKFLEATQKLLEIQKPSARIFYNLGCICMLQENYGGAIQYFNTSIDHDKYLVVALCQRGICYHEINRFDRAVADFRDALSKIHSEGIDYKKLGAEILLTPELLDHYAAVTEESSRNKKLVKLEALPVRDCIFRPPKAVVDNLVKQDFLGNATVISSTKEKDIVTATENRKLLHPGRQVKNQTSLSVPSSPASSRYQLDTSNAKKILIPPPKRPPPRLPSDIAVSQELRLKSKSLEDVTAGDLVFERTEEKSKLVNKVNFNSLTTNSTRLFPSPATGASHQPLINGGLTKRFQTDLPHLMTNQEAVSQPSSNTIVVPNVGRPVQNLSRNKLGQHDIPGFQISPRPGINQSASLGQGENADRSTGHAARMRSLFEQHSQPKINIVNTQKDRLDKAPSGSIVSSQQISKSTAQSSSLLPTVENSNVQKSTKPERPPKPKFSK